MNLIGIDSISESSRDDYAESLRRFDAKRVEAYVKRVESRRCHAFRLRFLDSQDAIDKYLAAKQVLDENRQKPEGLPAKLK